MVHRLRHRRGQFLPLVMLVIATTVLFLVAMANVFRVSKTKLELQNLADATALAVASLQAKSINVVVDRNEWMNNLYAGINAENFLAEYNRNDNLLPSISHANGHPFKDDNYARNYAKFIVASVNKAQWMFKRKYDQFLGAHSATGSSGGGQAALQDILLEIRGLTKPGTHVYVWNRGKKDLEDVERSETIKPEDPWMLSAESMSAMKFVTEPITVKMKNGRMMKLSQLVGNAQYLSGDNNEIGWVRPDWSSVAIEIKDQDGNLSPRIGTGVIVSRAVRLLPAGKKIVLARSFAYVDPKSGLVEEGGTTSGSQVGTARPPKKGFRPTFLVRLGYQ